MNSAGSVLSTAVAVAAAWGLWLVSGIAADWTPPVVAWPIVRLAVVVGGLCLLDVAWTRIRPPKLH